MASPKRIIMFEDERGTLELFRRLYEQSGFVFSGYEYPAADVAETVAEAKPDAISMDITMPYMDGLEASRLLKSDPRTKGVPIIFFTSHDNRSDRGEADTLGAAGYIVKGTITPEEVVRRVRLLIEKK